MEYLYKKCFDVQNKDASKYVIGCLNLGNKICTEKKIKGFINCPIDKKLIKKKGIYGVTEFIAKKSKIKKFSEVMMLYNKKLSVVPITTHIRVKNISKNIRKTLLRQFWKFELFMIFDDFFSVSYLFPLFRHLRTL